MGLDKYCYYEFKSKECGYKGDADFCPRMLQYCEAIGNHRNFPGSFKQKDTLEFCVTIIKETDAAFLVEDAAREGGNIWLPKSQIHFEDGDADDYGPGDVVTITLPEWLAIDKEFI